MQVLRETLGDIVEPIIKVLKKKPNFRMLEEQIRDEVPHDLETEEEKNEKV
jgi:hypothetical protein|tara:strand:+ start:660 stop:812 length:153 start_codon:yes stop_codon:yes gene_type:complete